MFTESSMQTASSAMPAIPAGVSFSCQKMAPESAGITVESEMSTEVYDHGPTARAAALVTCCTAVTAPKSTPSESVKAETACDLPMTVSTAAETRLDTPL